MKSDNWTSRCRRELNILLQELQEQYPTLILKGNEEVDKIIRFTAGDLKLKKIMGDAYPTAYLDSFADIGFLRERGFYVTYSDYAFGLERSGEISSGNWRNNHPRKEVIHIAEEYAKLINSKCEHYYSKCDWVDRCLEGSHEERYTWSYIRKIKKSKKIGNLCRDIQKDIVSYIEHGKKNSAPTISERKRLLIEK